MMRKDYSSTTPRASLSPSPAPSPNPSSVLTKNTISLFSTHSANSNQRYPSSLQYRMHEDQDQSFRDEDYEPQQRSGGGGRGGEEDQDDDENPNAEYSETNKLLYESEIELALRNAFHSASDSDNNNHNGGRLELAHKKYFMKDYFLTVLTDGLSLYASKPPITFTRANNPNNNNNNPLPPSISIPQEMKTLNLLEINLSHCSFTLKGFEMLLQTLAENIFTLQILNFTNCSLTKEFSSIVKNFLNSTRFLKKLILNNNFLSNYGLQIISEAFIFNNPNSSAAAASSTSANNISNPGMFKGRVSRGNSISSMQGSPLTINNEINSVTSGITLGGSALGNSNWKFLPVAPENSIFTLQVLDFSNNQIQDSGILSLCRSFLYYNKKLLLMKSIYSSLKVLKFNQNQITDKGLYCVSQLLNVKLISANGNNSPIVPIGGNKSPPKRANILVQNKYGVNLQELSFHHNPHITGDGIIAVLGYNHIATSTTGANSPSPIQPSSLFSPQSLCCIHSTLKTLDFGKCHLSLLIFQYLIPMITKGSFIVLENLNLDFTEENAREIVLCSAQQYNKVYGNNLSSVRSQIQTESSPTRAESNSNIVLSYCFQLLVDALLGINHKNRVSIKSIILGSLPKVIYDQCVDSMDILKDPSKSQGLSKAEALLIHNKFEDCLKTLEFMNPASEIFHIPYISNILAWIQGKQYHNLLYMTTPLSIFQTAGQASSLENRKKEKAETKGNLGEEKKELAATKELPKEHPKEPKELPQESTMERTKLNHKSTSPFRGVNRGKLQNSSSTSQKGLSPRSLNNSSANRAPGREISPPRESESPTFPTRKQMQESSTRKSPSPKRRSMSPSKADNPVHLQVSNALDSPRKLKSQQTMIPNIEGNDIQDLPDDQIKQLQDDHSVALRTLSTEIQKLIQVSTPATIRILSKAQNAEKNESLVGTGLSGYAVDTREKNVITVLDPLEIEKANISQMYHIPYNENGNSIPHNITTDGGLDMTDPYNQSFYYKQSLFSHEMQYQLLSVTESINEITSVENSKEATINSGYQSILPKELKKEQSENKFDVTIAKSEKSPERKPVQTKIRNLSPSSPSRRPNNDLYLKKFEEFKGSYQKEMESVQTTLLNVANHYSKLENKFHNFYEKKMLVKFTELENRIMKLEELVLPKPWDPNPSNSSIPILQSTVNERLVHNLATKLQPNTISSPVRSRSVPNVPILTSIESSNNVVVEDLTHRLEIMEKMLELQNQYDDRSVENSQISTKPGSTSQRYEETEEMKVNNDYKEKLLLQLSNLDEEIAKEKFDQDLENINQQNLLLLQTSRSVEGSPLSSSNVPTPSYLNYPTTTFGESQNFSQLPPAEDHQMTTTNKMDLHLMQNSISNLNRFQRIAALHNTFSQSYFSQAHDPLMGMKIDPQLSTDVNEELSAPTEPRSNLSSRQSNRSTGNKANNNNNDPPLQNKNRRPSSNQAKPDSVIPEYRYETLLPANFQRNEAKLTEPERRRSSTSPSRLNNRTVKQQDFNESINLSPVPVPVRQQTSQQNQHSSVSYTHHSHHQQRNFMLPTRAAELKRTSTVNKQREKV